MSDQAERSEAGFLGWFERLGNKLPDPAMIFVWLIGALVLISIAGAALGWSASLPYSGDKAPDWIILDDHNLQLRTERLGGGPGRTYTVTVTCTDAAGGRTSKSTTVFVPHDQGW